jgi:hypothetical protein
LGYLAQEWVATEDFDGGLSVLSALNGRYGKREGLEDAATTFAWRHVKPLADAGEIVPALDLLRRSEGLLADRDSTRLGEYVFDVNARPRLDRGEFEAAAMIYADGLKAFPDSTLLRNNRDYLMQEWVASAHKADGPAGAEAVTERLAAIFPDQEKVRKVSESESLRRLDALVRAGSFAEADAYRQEIETYLSEKAQVTATEMVFEAWARERMDAGDWIAAAKRYAAGLALAPSSHQLRQNAAYLAQEWARGGLENGGMEGFLAAAMQAKATLPDHPGCRKR